MESDMVPKNLVLRLMLLRVISCYLSFCHAQVPIPAKIDGFPYERAAVWGGSVVIEAFLDPLCPDSRDSWPPLKRALQHYCSRVSVVVHTFPLPYHSNAFLASRSVHIVNKLNASFVYPLLESFFKYQEGYSDQPTYTKTRASIVAEMTKLAVPIIGETNLRAFQAGFNDSQTDQATRISFKYGCSRGVTGTPYFFVNGIPLGDSGSPVDYSKWRTIIVPLLGKI